MAGQHHVFMFRLTARAVRCRLKDDIARHLSAEVNLELRPARRRTARRITAVAAVLVLFSACQNRTPIGTPNEIAVVTSRGVWDAAGQEIIAALEPRIFTVRDERILHVAYAEPDDVASSELRRMRRILLIGSAREPLIAEALAGRVAETLTPPTVVLLSDVWAKNQIVTVALLPKTGEPQVLERLLPRIRDIFLRELDEHIQLGMAAIPANERAAERLRRVTGVTLAVPQTYTHEQLNAGVFIFQRQEHGYTPIVRTITLDSRARGAVDWSAEAAREWRAELAERANEPPHVTETDAEPLQGELAGQPTIQIRGIWSNRPGEWPSAGPFKTRMVECAERVFLIDTWLYAPVDDKYEYMYQLDRILDTFRCPTHAEPARS